MHILREPLHRPSRSHGTRKNKTKHNGKYYFPNLTTWIKILIADCIQCQTNKVFANT